MNEIEKIKAREAMKLYAREWRKRKPDKAREIRERYWARRFDRMQAEAQQMQDAPADIAGGENNG